MLSYHHLTYEYVENLIELLVACDIKELFLEFLGFPKSSKAIFAATALNVLSLTGCNLELPSDGIKFSSLRELHLDATFLDERLLQALYASCNDLEVLSFRWFRGLTSLQVAGTLPKLRMVKLESCPLQFHSVDIVAPNLEDLCIISIHQGIDVIEITACKSLKKLHLQGVNVTDEWVEQLFSCIPNLEIFFLASCTSLNTMKISSDRLKCLTILESDNLIVVDLDTPNLLRFSCQVCYKERLSCHVDLLPTFKLKDSPLLEAVLYLIPETVDSHWYYKLIECLGNFKHSKAIELDCEHDKVIVIPKGLREILLPPLYGIKRLHIKIHDRFCRSVVDVVDSLLWTSPQLETLSFGQIGDLETLKFSYRDAADEDEKPCCASLPWKCWRHALKIVKLQNFTHVEVEYLRNYFFTNGDILEVIEVPPECRI